MSYNEFGFMPFPSPTLICKAPELFTILKIKLLCNSLIEDTKEIGGGAGTAFSEHPETIAIANMKNISIVKIFFIF